ncbi:MAG: alcohol dehydrogenase catalytic domain-containing protein [Gaiellales bacterium]|jgi:propanol-preferring alcohol dehydrogenase
MLAVRLHEGDTALHFDEIDVPVAQGDDQVVVKVNACGVCFSDIHVVDGDFGDKPRPLTLGHEVTGWTEEHGNVFVYTPWGCGDCRFCADGCEMICPDSHEAGLFDQGGYAEYMLVPHRRYIFPLGDLDPIDSAPLGCGGLTAYRAVKHALPFLGKGSKALVLGAGGLGQYAVQYLSMISDAEVHVGDPDPAKCATAKTLGATEAAAPADLTGPYSAVLDFVAAQASLEDGVRLVDRRGILIAIGLHGGRVPFGFGAVPMEARLMTSVWGSLADFGELIDLAQREQIRHVVERLPLADAAIAHERLRAGDVKGRFVLVP